MPPKFESPSQISLNTSHRHGPLFGAKLFTTSGPYLLLFLMPETFSLCLGWPGCHFSFNVTSSASPLKTTLGGRSLVTASCSLQSIYDKL